ncbi:uncharacterized protein [Montipora capricornis]|uniref:uncharacterized protein isoform X2 n=1 Tax=Montipora capricornis TaxID=246305 RepID=UPI0035F19784
MKIVLQTLTLAVLAAIVCGQFCTMETRDCSKVVPVISKLGAHSCDCDKDIHAGALKFDHGNFYVCSGKKWEAVLLKEIRKKPVYGSRLNPAKSCDDIVKNSPGKKQTSGPYWIKLLDDPTDTLPPIKFYCDMNKDGNGWTLAIKFSSFIQKLWPSPKTVMEQPAWGVFDEAHLQKGIEEIVKTSLFLSEMWAKFNASEVKVSLIKGGKLLDQHVIFKATGSSLVDWFHMDRLKESGPWYKALKEKKPVLALKDTIATSFSIQLPNWGVCEKAQGWLRIESSLNGICRWAGKGRGKQQIVYYSKGEGPVTWAKEIALRAQWLTARAGSDKSIN